MISHGDDVNPEPSWRTIADGTILRGKDKLLPKNLARRLGEINGGPGVISYSDGKPFSVFMTHDLAAALAAPVQAG
jgi:hypothetical protein